MSTLQLDLEPFEIDTEDDEFSDEQTGCCSECTSEFELEALEVEADDLAWEEEVRRGRRLSRPAARRPRPLRSRRPSLRRPRRLRSRPRPLPSGRALRPKPRSRPHRPRKRPVLIRPRPLRPLVVRGSAAPCICPAHGTEFARWVQSSLNQLLGLRLRVNGIMNRATRDALRDFQQQEGLPVDGIAGPETEKALVAAKARRSGEATVPSESEMLGKFNLDLADFEVGGSSEDDEEEAEFRVNDLPSYVRDAFHMGGAAWPLAVQRAIDAGIRDINKLTNIAFFMHHPERISNGKGRSLSPSEPSYGPMVELWKFLRSMIYPLLKKPTKPPTSTGAARGPVTEVDTPLPRSGIGFVASRGKPVSYQYGLPETIQALEEIGRRWSALYPGGPPIQISDISRPGGGMFKPHSSHRIGNDVDIRFIKKDGSLGAINPLIPSQKANFDKARTQELINIIRANGVLKVHRLWVNKYIGFDKATVAGDTIHNSHMHVRFCVPARYDLRAMRRAAKISPSGTYSTCA